MSERASTGWPCACSGERYAAVPSTAAVCATVSAVAVIAGDAEVRDLHLAARVQHDVARLDVAVDHALRVSGLERATHVHRDVRGAIGHDAPAAGQELGERPAFHVLHDDEVHAVVRARVEDRHDVLVGDPRRRLRLATEALDELVVLGEARREELDRHLAAQDGVVTEEDLGHAASSELVLDAVPPAEHDRLVAQSSPSPSAPQAASRTALAMGAATWPPVASLPRLPPSRTITATATRPPRPARTTRTTRGGRRRRRAAPSRSCRPR